jgi:hypothetical protein
MKTGGIFHAAVLGVLLFAPMAGVAQFTSAQNFAGSVAPVGFDGGPAASNAPESSLYADGTRAINEGRWSDAEAIFTKVAGQHGEHSDGALYWKAYAENKREQASRALATCAELRHDFPASSWVHECGALEIEIHARSGKPLEPSAAQDDDLKLLALNSLLRRDEPRALAEIQEILNGDSSEKLKQEALFILGNHYSNATYAQIVRLSYVEGDVRIARGERNEKLTGATWEQAVSDLPLEAGFSLVTGAGRAEIEFEDASTLYLGENSALTFNDLRTTAGVPYTELALLTGTATLHVRPYMPGELFVLKTPSEEFIARFPHQSYLRVSSYLDATAVTPLDGPFLRLSRMGPQAVMSGQTGYFRDGSRVDSAAAGDPNAFTAWDKWVADRVAQRAAAMAEVMQASGLTAPIPGLAEMKGQGTFFDCPPYGTCWEPSTADNRQQAGDKQPESESSSAESSAPPDRPKQAGSRASAPVTETYLEAFFPCLPAAIRYRTEIDPLTGRQRVIYSPFGASALPYTWAVCHDGSWIHQRHRYVWVVGHKRHHVEPVRWVKSGRTVAFVPIHPYDVKDRPPINRKEEVLAVGNKNGLSVERVKFDPDRPVEFLKLPPRECRNATLAPLSRADDPHLEARRIKDTFASKGALVKAAGVPLSFDHRSHSFMMAQQVMRGNRSVTVAEPVTNRGGNLQSRAPSFSGGGSFRSGGASGGSSGGSHGGGGGSSGGGGLHSGGGGGASTSSAGTGSSSTTSASSGSSSAGSSSGGGHR